MSIAKTRFNKGDQERPDEREGGGEPLTPTALSLGGSPATWWAPSSSLTLPELARHLAEAGIARFKLPERLELVDELPLSPFGKVSKVALAKRIAETLRAESP